MPANLENSAVAPGLEKLSFHSNSKERQCHEWSNYRTIALISHASKVMLKILQARLQQYVNRMVSCYCEGFCFPLSAYGPRLFTTYMISGHLVPARISLLIPSYLPAVRSPTPRPPLICFLCLLIRLWGTSLISRVYSMQSVASVFFHLAQSFGSSSML